MKEYYVNYITGDDGNSGTRKRPFRTLNGMPFIAREEGARIFFASYETPEKASQGCLPQLVFTNYGKDLMG